MKLTAMSRGGLYWSATVQDGNMTYTAPTRFPASERLRVVLGDIATETPGIEIAQEVTNQAQEEDQ